MPEQLPTVNYWTDLTPGQRWAMGNGHGDLAMICEECIGHLLGQIRWQGRGEPGCTCARCGATNDDD